MTGEADTTMTQACTYLINLKILLLVNATQKCPLKIISKQVAPSLVEVFSFWARAIRRRNKES